MNVIGQIVEERVMAENESLDPGGSYAKRWDAAFTAVRKRASCATVAREFGRRGSPRNNRKSDWSKE